jgi:hypothetical protein
MQAHLSRAERVYQEEEVADLGCSRAGLADLIEAERCRDAAAKLLADELRR